jgi:hypothetical protein
LIEGLRLRLSNGKLQMTRKFEARALTGTASERLAQALTLTSVGTAHTGVNLPVDGETFTVGGVTLYANDFDVEPWADADAYISVTYTTDKRGVDVAGYGPRTKEVGSTLELGETDFDWANLQLPYASRTRIQVSYDPSSAGAPGANAKTVDVRVPRWFNKSVRIYTNEQTVDPEGQADDFVGMVNSALFDGQPAGTLLCVSITGRYSGDGRWVRRVEIARDPMGFKQYPRYIDPQTGQAPALTTAQIAASNGIAEAEVQGEANFTLLNIL